MSLALVCAAAFFIGSIPTAYILGQLLKGVDIRQFGSGNVGATNAFRVLGKGPGIAVYVIDLLKGFLPVFFFSKMLGFPVSDFRAFSLIGFSTVLGHLFTPFLAFKGGKGVATGGGILLAAFPKIFALALLVWALCFGVCRIVSVSSIIACLSLLLFSAVFSYPAAIRLSMALIVLLVIWSHRSNIKRLIKGEGH